MQKTLLAAAAIIVLSAGGAAADTVAALVGAADLVQVDAKTGKATKTVRISGMPGAILGIDRRPADNKLYALGADGTVAVIDPATGVATVKSKLERTLPPGVTATVDFNPAADRLRVIGSDGTNLRANVDDGKVIVDGNLKFGADDKSAGKPPKVVAGAYTNAVAGTKETSLYDIDAAGHFLKQAPPNDGVLATIGPVGVPTEVVAFDIATDAQGTNWAWLVSGTSLARVDLATGKATPALTLAGVKGTVRDIAVLAD